MEDLHGNSFEDLDYTKINYDNKNEIIDILKDLMEITKL